MSRIVFIDVETLRLSTDPGMSWSHPEKFGLACAVTFDETFGFLDWVGDKKNAPEALLAYLDVVDRVIGHNVYAFDLAVIAGAVGKSPDAVRASLRGHVIDTFACVREATGCMVGLDALARGTLGRGKNGKGEDAPRLWMAGKREEVLQYCRRDCELTRDLYYAGLRGPLKYVAHGTAAGGTARVSWKAR